MDSSLRRDDVFPPLGFIGLAKALWVDMGAQGDFLAKAWEHYSRCGASERLFFCHALKCALFIRAKRESSLRFSSAPTTPARLARSHLFLAARGFARDPLFDELCLALFDAKSLARRQASGQRRRRGLFWCVDEIIPAFHHSAYQSAWRLDSDPKEAREAERAAWRLSLALALSPNAPASGLLSCMEDFEEGYGFFDHATLEQHHDALSFFKSLGQQPDPIWSFHCAIRSSASLAEETLFAERFLEPEGPFEKRRSIDLLELALDCIKRERFCALRFVLQALKSKRCSLDRHFRSKNHDLFSGTVKIPGSNLMPRPATLVCAAFMLLSEEALEVLFSEGAPFPRIKTFAAWRGALEKSFAKPPFHVIVNDEARRRPAAMKALWEKLKLEQSLNLQKPSAPAARL